jgi:small subunit ribosomal protein S4
MPKRRKKNYSRPQRPFDKARIESENLLRDKYGLKNKREIWKADTAIGKIRNQAKQLITAGEDEQKAFVERLQKKGYQVESIADALALDKEDLLKRRLQTIVQHKGLANTPKQARQFITHKHVSIGNQVVNIPSYHVSLEEEPEVKMNLQLEIKTPKKSKVEEIKEAMEEEKETEPVEETNEEAEDEESKEEPVKESETEENNKEESA